MVFEAPHSPFDPPEPYDRMYYNFTIPEPVIGDWVENEYPPALQEKRWERKYDQLNHDMLMEARRHYYGQISYIDYQLARFFGELKKKGLYDNTLIVFTADHGESLGDHGQFDKYTFLNCACRVPLIMTLPASLLERNLKAATENPVMLADICPTLMVAAGIEPDSTCDGSAMLVEEFKEPQASPRVICGETPESVYAVNGLWKYIYYFHGGVEQLFSIQKDPDDLHNLAGDPGLSGEKDLLKQALIHYLKQCNRPCVSEDGFLYQPIHLNEMESRKKNPAAWRGPLRYGEGY
jgi:arylsulfatase A-like enzyme